MTDTREGEATRPLTKTDYGNRAMHLLQASSCFRGKVCSIWPCACAESLVALLQFDLSHQLAEAQASKDAADEHARNAIFKLSLAREHTRVVLSALRDLEAATGETFDDEDGGIAAIERALSNPAPQDKLQSPAEAGFCLEKYGAQQGKSMT